MGTGASSAVETCTERLSSEELKDPKSVMFDSARSGHHDQLLLVIQQGMDPNERESPSSG